MCFLNCCCVSTFRAALFSCVGKSDLKNLLNIKWSRTTVVPCLIVWISSRPEVQQLFKFWLHISLQDKHVSTSPVTVSYQWITHTLGTVCVCTLLREYLCCQMFEGLCSSSRCCWALCRYTPPTVGALVFVSQAGWPLDQELASVWTCGCFQAAVGLFGGSWQQWDCNSRGETKSSARVYVTLPVERWSVRNTSVERASSKPAVSTDKKGC